MVSFVWRPISLEGSFKAQRISRERKGRMQELDEGKKDNEGLCYGQDMAKEFKISQEVS